MDIAVQKCSDEVKQRHINKIKKLYNWPHLPIFGVAFADVHPSGGAGIFFKFFYG